MAPLTSNFSAADDSMADDIFDYAFDRMDDEGEVMLALHRRGYSARDIGAHLDGAVKLARLRRDYFRATTQADMALTLARLASYLQAVATLGTLSDELKKATASYLRRIEDSLISSVGGAP